MSIFSFKKFPKKRSFKAIICIIKKTQEKVFHHLDNRQMHPVFDLNNGAIFSKILIASEYQAVSS